LNTASISLIATVGLLACSALSAAEPDAEDARSRGAAHLAEITAQPWLADWKASAASVLAYWIDHGYPQWRGDAGVEPLPGLTKRIRARLNIDPIPDKDGYTDDGMTLAGAMPEDLARAIQVDAGEHHVPVISAVGRFRFESLQSEIGAGRPVILGCVVRLPQKPQLSWGHEVAGVGWAKIGEVRFVGIVDNFYPVENPATIRWIRTDAFDSLIAIRPAPKD